MKENAALTFPFSKYIRVNELLYISGTISSDRETLENEVHGVMKQLGLMLKENSLSYQDLVSVTVYLKNMEFFPVVNEIYRTYFERRFPTRTCIAVLDLPLQARVEMSAIASISASSI